MIYAKFNLLSRQILSYRANLIRTFKTEYQPPTGAASESSKSEKDLLLFLLSIWQNRKSPVVGR